MTSQDEYYYFQNYQFVAGVLAEFDPAQMLSCIYEDVNTMLNFVLAPSLGLPVDGEIPVFMQSSMNYITRETASRGKMLTLEDAHTYGAAVAQLSKAYVDVISATPIWFTHYAQWLSARYHSSGSGAVEFSLRYSMEKLGQNASIANIRHLSPEVQSKLEMLIGRLGTR